jgi:hypothetical protein
MGFLSSRHGSGVTSKYAMEFRREMDEQKDILVKLW